MHSFLGMHLFEALKNGVYYESGFMRFEFVFGLDFVV